MPKSHKLNLPARFCLKGLVLTAWQRYDHFAVLCELLPAAIPSMVLNLIVATDGGYDWAKQEPRFKNALNCASNVAEASSYTQGDFDWIRCVSACGIT